MFVKYPKSIDNKGLYRHNNRDISNKNTKHQPKNDNIMCCNNWQHGNVTDREKRRSYNLDGESQRIKKSGGANMENMENIIVVKVSKEKPLPFESFRMYLSIIDADRMIHGEENVDSISALIRLLGTVMHDSELMIDYYLDEPNDLTELELYNYLIERY